MNLARCSWSMGYPKASKTLGMIFVVASNNIENEITKENHHSIDDILIYHLLTSNTYFDWRDLPFPEGKRDFPKNDLKKIFFIGGLAKFKINTYLVISSLKGAV